MHHVKTSTQETAMGSQSYGVQVGNETYSVIATDEDWEKRRIERERQKRLSQETNRRRKALEERKKLAEEREARKRILQLSKRRQRQTEATEKYQRAHISTKSDRKLKNASGIKRSPALDNVLQQLRSGNTEITYPYSTEGSRVTSTQLMNHSRFQFESKLQEEHRRLLELHRANVTKEFDGELFDELHSNDFENSSTGGSPQSFYPAQSPQDFCTVDLMSGRMQTPIYHPAPVHPQGPPSDDAPKPDVPYNREVVQLADSLSRLFTKEEPRNTVQRHSDVDPRHEDDPQHGLHNVDNGNQSLVQQQYVRPPSGKKRAGFSQKHVIIHEAWRSPSDVEFSNDEPNNQESLHGSSGSGTPPVVNTMTSFQKKYAEPTNVSACEQLDNGAVKVQTTAESSPRYFVDSNAGYYVKAYRPWSAIEDATTRSKEKDDTKHFRQRPMSAAVAQNNVKPPRQPPTLNEVPSRFTSEPENATFQDRLEAGKESNARWSASSVKTKATPISEMYNEAWMKPVQLSEKSDNMTAYPTVVVSSPTSPVVVSKPPKEDIPAGMEVAPPSSAPAPAHKVGSNAKPEFANNKKSEETSNASRKSILREVSKYTSKPSYHSEAAAARQHWVDHMTGLPNRPISMPTLNGADVRDSLDMKSKSVRWHEIHYDDGTSATFTESGTIMQKAAGGHNLTVASSKRSPRTNNKSPKNKPQSKPKAKSSPEKSGKKSPKGAKGRKLKPAKEAEVTMEPHPPATTKKQLSIANNLNYSIASESEQPNRTRANEQKRTSRTAWAPQETENVTLDTLKSSGSHNVDAASGPPHHGRHKNQVTINIESPEAEEPLLQEQTINLTKTPTDQEINWLWDKVRKCISQRNNGRGAPLCKSSSDTSRFSGSSTVSRHSMYGAPPSGQQRASIVSIDGAMFSPNNTPAHGPPQSRGRRFNRPHSAVNIPTRQINRLNEYGTNLRRQALLQQRRNKLLNIHRAGQVKSPVKYSPHYPSPQQIPPTQSFFEPFPSARGSVGKVDDSTTTFLLAETLAEQNLSEEQITKAMESLERRTKDAQASGRQVLPSALSIEEKHLLKSLERLNARLCEVEMAMSSNPNADFFHTTNGSKFRPNRVHSAEVRRPPHYGQLGRHQNF